MSDHTWCLCTLMYAVTRKVKSMATTMFWLIESSILTLHGLKGASTTCYLALHPQLKGTTGAYFADNNMAKASGKAGDTDLAKKLWDFSMDLIK